MIAQQIYHNVGHVAAMLFLLGGSAFFSGAETAFFNLTRRQVKHINKSESRVHGLLARLLNRPGLLLNCLLLGNMTVNVLFFAVSSVLVLRARTDWGVATATGLALATFIVLVLFGEILPKSLAYANSWRIALAAALPAFVIVKVFGPAAFVARAFILEPVLRIFVGQHRSPSTVTTMELRSLIDFSRRRGLISSGETKLFAEVVRLGFLKVRHVMQPRVDIVACDISAPPSTAVDQMRQHGLTKIPVYAEGIDGITGIVHLRQILLRPGLPLERLARPVRFVPEQKTVESIVDFFRTTRTDMAVVVDEYGGIAGVVRLEDIVEELFGGFESTDRAEPIQLLGPFEYRLSGDLAIHEWADVFGIDLSETRLATLGGLITALLGKIPKQGDVAQLKNLRFAVERMHRHRIESVVMTLEPIPSDGK
jgi:putative hemolysin